MILANISNGLAFEHDDVCYFQSQYAHHLSLGYFRVDSMPYKAVIHLLKGGQLEIIDATHKDKPLSDAMLYGVGTWCLVMNRALKHDYKKIKVCEWQTKEMITATDKHKRYIQSLRKLIKIYGRIEPVVIGNQIKITCYNNFQYDDRMENVLVK